LQVIGCDAFAGEILDDDLRAVVGGRVRDDLELPRRMRLQDRL